MSDDESLKGLGEPWPAVSMPGRLGWLTWCCGAFAASVAAVAAAILAVPEAAVVLPALLVAQIAVFAAGPLMRRLRLRQLLKDPRYRTARADALEAAILDAVAPSGVGRLTIRVGQVAGFARNFRAGGHAVLLIHERLVLRPEAATFLIAHESAHVARYDQMRRPAAMVTIVICCGCVAVVWLPAFVVAAVAAVAAIGVLNRAMELDCDRLGVRWIGLAAAEQAFSLIEAAYGQRPKNAVRRARSLLTYPSPRRRLAASRAVRPGSG